MVVVLTTLLFATAAAVSLWTIFATIAPRIDYIRSLMLGGPALALTPVATARVRVMPRPAPRRAAQALRAAA